MENSKKLIFILLSIILILSIIVGCNAQKSENVSSDKADSTASEEAKFGGDSASPLEPEKVITTIDLKVETTEFDESNDELNSIIEKHEAYVEYSNISYSSKVYRNGQYVIRVPKDNIKNFKLDLDAIGNIIRESANKQDVTKQYTDTKSRLKVLEVQEERILTLMKKATEIEDIIALEEHLSEVIYEKEKLQSNLMELDDKIDFNTINLSIQEVEKLSSSTTQDTSFGREIIDAIDDSLYFFKNTLERLVIVMIYLLPFIVIISIIVFAGYKGIIRYKKKK